MRLGGFVIHRNNVDTLAAALSSLQQVCDDVIAVDTGSTDGSAQVVEALGVRRARVEWAGFGAARQAAVEQCTGADYLLFLDSDEFLEPESLRRIRRWKESGPTQPYYALKRRDWYFEKQTPRFVFRSEWRKRLIRRDAARWEPRMIVHEALPSGPTGRVAATVEHRFADESSLRDTKDRAYALLWAVMNHASLLRLKSPSAQYAAHWLRNAVVKGGLRSRCGLQLSAQAARYHRQKYEDLRLVREGAYPELVQLFDAGEFAALFRRVREELATRQPPPPRPPDRAAQGR